MTANPSSTTKLVLTDLLPRTCHTGHDANAGDTDPDTDTATEIDADLASIATGVEGWGHLSG